MRAGCPRSPHDWPNWASKNSPVDGSIKAYMRQARRAPCKLLQIKKIKLADIAERMFDLGVKE